MSKTRIEWCDYTINPVKGLCPVACSYCYARRLYKRFKWDETIRFEAPALIPPKGAKIFVGSTIELFGEWIRPDWLKSIFSMVEHHPENTFIFLTKRPENLIKWSPFPENCWVGVSAINTDMLLWSLTHLEEVRAKVKFVSLEPLLDWSFHWEPSYLSNALNRAKIKWVIIGQKTPHSIWTQPNVEWIKDIVESADRIDIPVFLKNNLKNLLPQDLPFWELKSTRTEDVVAGVVCTQTWDEYRQEFPYCHRKTAVRQVGA